MNRPKQNKTEQVKRLLHPCTTHILTAIPVYEESACTVCGRTYIDIAKETDQTIRWELSYGQPKAE